VAIVVLCGVLALEWPSTFAAADPGAGPAAGTTPIGDIIVSDIVGAQYFAQGHYVTSDECAGDSCLGDRNNNASHRRINVIHDGGESYRITVPTSSATREQDPVIRAWRAADATVMEVDAQVPGEGLFIFSTKVSHLGEGYYDYEYALFNMNSDRAAGKFSIPLPPGVDMGAVDFHDVDYPSEPWDGTDWVARRNSESLTWATIPFESDPNANALRWDTLYNFRFVARGAPVSGQATGGLFKPGDPVEILVETQVPAPTILVSSPPDSAIDAREDVSDESMVRQGFQRIRFEFAEGVGDPATSGLLNSDNFSVEAQSGTVQVAEVELVAGSRNTHDVFLTEPIPAGEWTSLGVIAKRADDYTVSAEVRLGFLPGDVSGNGTSSPSDILELIDGLNHVRVPPLEIWQCDIDRSEVCNPADILRTIDLLNGVGTTWPWLNVSLPPRPSSTVAPPQNISTPDTTKSVPPKTQVIPFMGSGRSRNCFLDHSGRRRMCKRFSPMNRANQPTPSVAGRRIGRNDSRITGTNSRKRIAKAAITSFVAAGMSFSPSARSA